MLMGSEFIKGLLDLPSTQQIDQAPIHVHQTGDIVRQFVDCIVSSKSHDLSLTLADTKHFLDLCGHLQASTISLSVLDSLKTRMGRVEHDPGLNAWEVLKLAADHGDVALAKIAVGCFGRSNVGIRGILATKSPSFFDDIPPRYVFALLRSFAHPSLVSVTWNNSHLPAVVFVSESEAAKAFSLD